MNELIIIESLSPEEVCGTISPIIERYDSNTIHREDGGVYSWQFSSGWSIGIKSIDVEMAWSKECLSNYLLLNAHIPINKSLTYREVNILNEQNPTLKFIAGPSKSLIITRAIDFRIGRLASSFASEVETFIGDAICFVDLYFLTNS
ncbi:hypothetical protein [Motilimonas eburnea]|uniref:hypothetical protein n=1 Tax=Motilimonas eburnea TaxID=1737488 RepID=UPI001E364F6C|nr:hypothetical protein [Motilimonas eburnea]MCE2571736.1 hypothetical protein [Motilimonas eburnea]